MASRTVRAFASSAYWTENIKALADWLGHADPAFTLRVYAHRTPESPQRARRALDALLGGLPGIDGPETARTHV
jgi:integrase